jgi:hypothetical protein
MLATGAGRTARFAISSRGGVWQVTRNEVFFGDYLSRDEATRSACSAARSYEAGGGSAVVVTSPGDALVAHQHANLNPSRAARGRSPR